MKNLSSVLVSEKNKIASDKAWLFALEVRVIDPLLGTLVETIRLVRNDEETIIDGETFTPFPFEPDIRESDGIPTLNIVIQDQTQVVQEKMDEYGGAVGFEVSVIVVSGDDASSMNSEPELVEDFEVVESSVADYVVTWRLSVPNPLNVSFPRRRQYSDQCSFRYKSTECGYDGEIATCDLTLNGANGCSAHSNEANFGGFPGIKIRSV